MESSESTSKLANKEIYAIDELANLKKIDEINNSIACEFGDLVIRTSSDNDIKEITELWANLATVQQIYAPDRFSFNSCGKDWQAFVKRKISKKYNLLLVAHKKGDAEIRGFLYLQTITLPSSDLVLKAVIEDIYTKPQYRRQGIASKIMDVSLEWASNQSVKQVDFITLTNEKIKGLSAFYSRFQNKFKENVNLELVTF